MTDKFEWKKGDVVVTKIVYNGVEFDHVPTKEEKEATRKEKED